MIADTGKRYTLVPEETIPSKAKSVKSLISFAKRSAQLAAGFVCAIALAAGVPTVAGAQVLTTDNVCGKTADVAELQDELTGALIGLARATDGDTPVNADTWRLMIEGLFTTVTNVNFNEKTIRELINRVHAERERLAPNGSGCGSRCGRNDDYDMNLLWKNEEYRKSVVWE